MEQRYSKKEAEKLYKENGSKILSNESTGFVSVKRIDKVYPNGVQAVYDFNLDIEKHDFVALVGPSGCGKSTTLRMIAGLEEITSGELFIDGVLSNYLPSKERDIAMVFQSYALYPQLNVYDNIAFGLKIRKYPKEEIKERVFKAADILDLGPYLDRKPKELSGGQMQRVALGRAIVRNAKLFLMDEPLSNLDAKLRVQMRSEIVRIHEEVEATTIYVTHDQTEAMTMANKIVVMSKGFVQQVGEPMDVYNYPKNLFVATFIGTPPMNIIDGIYDNGEIIVSNLFNIKLDNSFKEYHNNYYQNQIKVYEDYLTRIDNLSEKGINDFKLSINSRKNIVEKLEIKFEEPTKKLKFKFKKNKDVISIESIRNEFKEYLVAMIEKYRECLLGKHNIKIGIRPEDIYLSSNYKGNISESFELKCNLVEVLGSEFIVHSKIEKTPLVIKLQDNVKSHSIQNFVINTDKIHLFDEFSGENISYEFLKEGEK